MRTTIKPPSFMTTREMNDANAKKRTDDKMNEENEEDSTEDDPILAPIAGNADASASRAARDSLTIDVSLKKMAASGKLQGYEYVADKPFESRQVEQLVALARDANIEKLAIMPNFKAGQPFIPPSGYVLLAKSEMPFSALMVDQATLFKGRSILPLFLLTDEATQAIYKEATNESSLSLAIEKKIDPIWFVNTTHSVIKQAFDLINQAVKTGLKVAASNGTTVLIAIEPSEAVQPHISLLEAVRDESDVYILAEVHAIPMGHELSDLVQRFADQRRSLFDFYQHDLVKRYMFTLRVLRALVCKLMGYEIVKAIVSDLMLERMTVYRNPLDVAKAAEMTEANSGFLQWLTNMIIPANENKHFFYYNDALDVEHGAIIDNGPFCELVWANYRLKATALIAKADRCGGVPYDMPTTMDRAAALEAAVLSHYMKNEKLKELERQTDYDVAEDEEARAALQETEVTEDGAIIAPHFEHHPTIFSAGNKFIAGPSVDAKIVGYAPAMRAQKSVSMIVWRESAMHMPVAIPDKVVNYHRSLGDARSAKVLEMHGILINTEFIDTNRLMRVVLRALGPVNDLDQLMMWRAAGEVHHNKRQNTRAPTK